MEKVNDANDSFNSSEEKGLCKICHCEEYDENPFVYPCKCKGSLKYIHSECLEEWMKLSKITKCDICKFNYRFQKTYKEGTPNRVPLTLFITYGLHGLMKLFKSLFMILYLITKLTIVLFLNTMSAQLCLSKEDSVSALFFVSTAVSIANLLNTLYLKKILKVISSVTGRIQTSRVLHNLVSDIATRSADSVSRNSSTDASNTNISGPFQDSESEFSDENAIFTSTDLGIAFSSFFNVLKIPSFDEVREDFKIILLLTHLSFLIPLLSLFNRMFKYITAPIMSRFLSCIKNTSTISMYCRFLKKIKMDGFFAFGASCTTLVIISLSVLYFLKKNTSHSVFKTLFCLIKAHFLIFDISFIIIPIFGTIVHYCFASIINNNVSIFPLNLPIAQIIVHYFVGVIFVFLNNTFKDIFAKRFRSGLIYRPLSDRESFSSIVRTMINSSFLRCLIRAISSFSIFTLIVFVCTKILSYSIDFKFNFENKKWLFLYLKALLYVFANGNNMSTFFASCFEGAIRVLSKLFDADNFLFNIATTITDKNRLRWHVNTDTAGERYYRKVVKINRVLQNRSKVNATKTTTAGGGDETHQSNSSFDESNISPHNSSDMLNTPEINTKNIFKSSLRDVNPVNQSSNTFGGTDNSSDRDDMLSIHSFAESNDTCYTRLRQVYSKSYLNTIKENADEKIARKYEITERKILKYYGQKHNKVFSIFLLPKHFYAFVFLCITSSLIILFSSCALAAKVAIQLIRFLRIERDEVKSVTFVYFFFLTIGTLSKVLNVVKNCDRNKTVKAMQSLVVDFYSNFFYPCITALCYVVIVSKKAFAEFTYMFILLNSISTLISVIFRTVFYQLVASTGSLPFLVKSLTHFFVFKSMCFALFFLYNRIIPVSSIIFPIAILFFILYQTVKLVSAVISGRLSEQIKEYFFLERTSILNYEQSEEQ